MPPRDRPQPGQQLLALPISIRLAPGQRDGLSVLAESRGVAIGAVVRAAIDAYLSGYVDSRTGRTLLEDAQAGELGDYTDFAPAGD